MRPPGHYKLWGTVQANRSMRRRQKSPRSRRGVTRISSRAAAARAGRPMRQERWHGTGVSERKIAIQAADVGVGHLGEVLPRHVRSREHLAAPEAGDERRLVPRRDRAARRVRRQVRRLDLECRIGLVGPGVAAAERSAGLDEAGHRVVLRMAEAARGRSVGEVGAARRARLGRRRARTAAARAPRASASWPPGTCRAGPTPPAPPGGAPGRRSARTRSRR